MTHVSLDIEACGEVLLSVGACEFSPETGAHGATFYGVLAVQPQLDKGLKMDGGAWEWWLKQSDAARRALDKPEAPEVVLPRLHAFMAQMGECWLWAYPTSFDLPVVARVCGAFGVRPPWKWTRTMDGRTLWQLACAIDPKMAEIEREAGDAGHHALTDAMQQATWFAKYLAPVLRGASL